MLRRPVVAALVPWTLLLAAGCTAGGPAAPMAAVTPAEAGATVAQLVDLAGRRTPASMRELCALHDCTGLSSGITGEPGKAPPTPPTERCTVALPPTGGQRGMQLVVLEGVRGDGRDYLTQVLVERTREGLRVPEPGFWLGIRYSSLQGGRAWSGDVDDVAGRARFRELAERACTDTDAWVGEVAGT